MKKLSTLIAFTAVAALAATSSFAAELNTSAVIRTVGIQMMDVQPLDIINWKVGDTQDYDVSVGSFGKLGKMTKSVTKDEGAALWVTSDVDIMIQKDHSEMLMNKADGKILKFIHNGKEEAAPEDKVTLISQNYEEVTVPAGKFKAVHVVAKTEKIDKVELWANPKETVMEGGLKEIVNAQGQVITLELTSFKKIP